jgi:hypothetical protein
VREGSQVYSGPARSPGGEASSTKYLPLAGTAEDLKPLGELSKLAPEYPAWRHALGSDRRPGERRYRASARCDRVPPPTMDGPDGAQAVEMGS